MTEWAESNPERDRWPDEPQEREEDDGAQLLGTRMAELPAEQDQD